ncbi:sensor histidine kinase [Paenibacillus sp. P26]|nr:sensor histidine kinase [Paenibacillus sp. P26]UUZ96945.1 sensor histidine kinase [Paenibacillus sp. P25]
MRGTRSIQFAILWRLIPGLIFFVVTTGIASYILSADQLKSNAFANIYDTVSQTKNYMDDRLNVLLSAVVAMSNNNFNTNSDLLQSLHRSDSPTFIPGPNDYLAWNGALNQFYSYDMVDSVVLWYNNGAISVARTDHFFSLRNFSAEPYLSRPAGSNATVFWKNLHERDIPFSGDVSTKVASLYEWIGSNGPNPDGVYIVNIKPDFFKKILNSPKISENGCLMLVSPDGIMRFKPFSGKYELDDEQLQKQLLASPDAHGRLDVRSKTGAKMDVIYDTVSTNRWKLAAVFPEEEVLSKVNNIKYLSLMIMFGAVLFAILFAALLARYISKPIQHLTRQVNRIEEGHLIVAVKKWPQYEMTVLNKGLKDMVDRIGALLRQVKEEQEMKRQMEISLLQAQIQPHFLYNTLFSIKRLCDMGEAKEAGSMITALSTFFRISISKGQEVISIAQELEQVQTYLFIQKMRYGDVFHYEIEVEPSLLDYPIVKLTLQPLVENAIYHGIKKSEEQGRIQITGYDAGEDIYLYVQDNGIGMHADKLAEIKAGLSDTGQAKVGFGIGNVHRRLQMHYGDDCGLYYESEPGKGTVVMVKIRKASQQPAE